MESGRPPLAHSSGTGRAKRCWTCGGLWQLYLRQQSDWRCHSGEMVCILQMGGPEPAWKMMAHCFVQTGAERTLANTTSQPLVPYIISAGRENTKQTWRGDGTTATITQTPIRSATHIQPDCVVQRCNATAFEPQPQGPTCCDKSVPVGVQCRSIKILQRRRTRMPSGAVPVEHATVPRIPRMNDHQMTPPPPLHRGAHAQRPKPNLSTTTPS